MSKYTVADFEVTERSSLKTNQMYRETMSGDYFYTPDCVGVVWGTKEEIEEDLIYTTCLYIDQLDD